MEVTLSRVEKFWVVFGSALLVCFLSMLLFSFALVTIQWHDRWQTEREAGQRCLVWSSR